MKYTDITKLGRLLLIAILPFFVWSCDSLLDIDPKDQIDGKDIFSSIDRLEKGVLGVYADWYPEHTIRIASLMTDECRIGLQNSGVDALGQNLFRWTYTSSDDEILAPWENAYQVIGRVNYILRDIDKVPIKGAEEKEKIETLRGELLAIRAYLHLDLYRIYGYSGVYDAQALAIPYITEYDINKQPSRPTTEKFFEQLWKDLSDAENLQTSDSKDRMGALSIEALHARAALYAAKYEEAEQYASKVIAKTSLASKADFTQIWLDKSDSEIIFKLKRNNMSKIRPGDIFYNINSDKILFAPSLKLMHSYDENNDVRHSAWYDSDDSLTESGDLSDTVIKYSGDSNAQNRNDIKVFRVSEMYLIRAEAYFQLGNNTSATNDLNTLRRARIEEYQDVTYTGEELYQEIFEERFKELPYEGHRFFDLRRLNYNIERDVLDVDTTLKTLTSKALHYNIPLPQSEVMANPNIRPNNKGW